MTSTKSTQSKRLHLDLQGLVQGVGFRPFVYHLATELHLGGWVRNSADGAEIEVEGLKPQVMAFMERLNCDHPPQAVVSQQTARWLTPCGDQQFKIYPSIQHHVASAWILPDLATCLDCLQEIFDPDNRRYHYPLTTCTQCGPRYSILDRLPYDRSNTTLYNFALCETCQQEYESPTHRRFHAQTNACPDCGPRLELRDSTGARLDHGSNPSLIQATTLLIRQGNIIAIKGIGGFHLIVEACNLEAVQRLRDRKYRPTKPLALMYPTLEHLKQDCFVSIAEAQLLTSVAAPIVLLKPRENFARSVMEGVAPHQSRLGVMLPYSPLHHLILAELNGPVVVTSGNRSQSPLCFKNDEAVKQLTPLADAFLVHNRPIVRPVDDSVVQVVDSQPMILRRARGYAPSPIPMIPNPDGTLKGLPSLLAVGGHLKNTIALSLHNQIVLSQHLGNLDEVQTFDRFQKTISQLIALYEVAPTAIACDLHPDYTSTQVAQTFGQHWGVPVVPIQHHYAHALSGMVDNGLNPPVFGVVWDGTGYGPDYTLWGGEFLFLSHSRDVARVAHLKTFALPGGDRAVRQPYRSALGVLYEVFGDRAFEVDFPDLRRLKPSEIQLLRSMLRQRVNAPMTSSIGRLFDAIASLVDLCSFVSFEGEAAMRLEARIANHITTDRYPYTLDQGKSDALELNWHPMIPAILADRQARPEIIAAKFHNTLIDALVAIAHHVGCPQVLLTGGCFQNRYLLEGAIQRLRQDGFLPYWHRHVPPNDGGLAVGQLLGAAWHLEQTSRGGLRCV